MKNPALKGIWVVAIDGLADGRLRGGGLGADDLEGNGLDGDGLEGDDLSAFGGSVCQRRYGVASLGLRPTVENTTRYSLEVHVFDWAGHAYGQRVNIVFLHKLRDEAAYVDLATLQMAIAQDMRDARAWLAHSVDGVHYAKSAKSTKNMTNAKKIESIADGCHET